MREKIIKGIWKGRAGKKNAWKYGTIWPGCPKKEITRGKEQRNTRHERVGKKVRTKAARRKLKGKERRVIVLSSRKLKNTRKASARN